MQLHKRSTLFLAILAVFAASCASDDPVHVGRPPVIQGFSPGTRSIDAFVGDTLLFTIRAIDPDRDPLLRRFTLNDSTVASGDRWQYVVRDSGVARVRAVVTDDHYESHIDWTVRAEVLVNLPPVLTQWSPVEPRPTMIIGKTLSFAVEANDPEGRALSYTYAVDDSVVAHDDDYTHVATRTGLRLVEARVFDGERATVHSWTLLVTGVPDTIPPAEVILTKFETGAEPGDVDVEWVAVGKDGMVGLASDYMVRTSPAPILSELDWSRGTQRPGVPAPQPPGSVMTMTVVGITPARFTYVAVRAVDDFGNLSPLRVSPGTFARGMRITGVIRDATTDAPVPGIIARLGYFQTTSDAAGEVVFAELPPILASIWLTDDDQQGTIGTYYDFAMPYTIVHGDRLTLYMIPDLALTTSHYPSFYIFFRAMTNTIGIPTPSGQRRWELPIDFYIEPHVGGGLDYAAVIREVALEIDEIVGQPAFNFVSALPTVGLHVEYDGSITNDNYLTYSWSKDFYPLQARITFRTHYAAATEFGLRQIARHEIGHALGLNHSEDNAHVMVGGQAPAAQAFTTDERNVIQIRYRLPRGLDMNFYVVD